MFCVVSILCDNVYIHMDCTLTWIYGPQINYKLQITNDLVDDSLWPVYGVVSRLHLVRCRLAPVFADCVCTNFSVNFITGENYTVKSFNDFYSSPSIVWVTEVDRSCGIYGDRRGVYTGFCWRNLREGYHLEDQCVDGRIILNGFQEIV